MGDEEDIKLVELASFLDGGAAHIARSVLDAHEIDSFVFNDNAASIGIGSTMMNARLMVASDDLDDAKAILEQEMEAK